MEVSIDAKGVLWIMYLKLWDVKFLNLLGKKNWEVT